MSPADELQVSGHRTQAEFVSFSIQVVCERSQAEEAIGAALTAAADSPGCILALPLGKPRSLTSGEWDEVDEAVNFLVDFQS
jgi:hypothetical protein